MIFRLVFSLVILALVFLIIDNIIGIKKLPQIILSFPKQQLILLFLLVIFITFLKACRFLVLLRFSGVKISLWDTVKVYIASQTTSFLPGGEVLRGVLIKKESGVALSKTAGTVISQVYLEIIAACLITFLGSFYFEILRVPMSFMFLFFVLFSFLFLHPKISFLFFKKLPKNERLKKIYLSINKHQKLIVSNLFSSKRIFFITFGISLVGQILGGSLIFLIGKSDIIQIGLFESVFVYSSSIVIQTLAVFSPGGLGFTEGGMIGILLLFKLDPTKSVSLVVIFRIITLFFPVMVGMVFLGLFYGKSLIFSKYKILSKKQ